jgi:hypothetical protein
MPCFCRLLQSLSQLELSFVPIDLHALAAIAPQLCALILQKCRLTCRADFSFFDSGFANLEDLDVTDSILHARLGAVNLPSLTKLSMPGFAAQLGNSQRSRPSFDCIEAFAHGGCPQCTHLAFRPVWRVRSSMRTVSCKTFGTLRSVRMEFDSWSTRDPSVWPARLPKLDLPVGVASLTCGRLAADGQAHGHVSNDLELLAVLGIAARSIEAGVQLSELRCEHCSTCVIHMIDEDDGTMYEPDERMHANHYRPLLCSLHGLERLDLSKSPNCQQETVDEIVQFAPDLLHLEVMVNWAGGWRQKRVMHCLGLSEVAVHYHLGSRRSSEPLALELDLQACADLDAFSIHGLQWEPMSQDRVTVVLECQPAPDIVADAACDADGAWTLRCSFGVTHHEDKQVAMSFVVGPDLVWSASVQEVALA